MKDYSILDVADFLSKVNHQNIDIYSKYQSGALNVETVLNSLILLRDILKTAMKQVKSDMGVTPFLNEYLDLLKAIDLNISVLNDIMNEEDIDYDELDEFQPDD